MWGWLGNRFRCPLARSKFKGYTLISLVPTWQRDGDPPKKVNAFVWAGYPYPQGWVFLGSILLKQNGFTVGLEFAAGLEFYRGVWVL